VEGLIKKAIKKLVEKRDLSSNEAKEVMKEIMSGLATEAQFSAFVTALRMKGETIEEITALTRVMKDFCFQIHPKVEGRLIDTCGTGGDKIKTFNVSTISAFVVAGALISVAKHGNRSFTSKSGSADVLESLGLNLDIEPKKVEKIIEKVNIGFMYAPKFHPAMKYAKEPRRQIGIRTTFNILGPLTNPASANAQVLGVYDNKWLMPLVHVLKNLGCSEAMIVYGEGGLDEISIIGKTTIAWLKDREVSIKEFTPRDFGFKKAKPKEILGTTAESCAELTFKILNGYLKDSDPKRNMVLLNAAAGIIVGGKTDNMISGIELAAESINSGSAYKKLKMLISSSGGNTEKIEEFERKYA
jgi:anthranilate phosphoribosyltransferase